MNESNRQSDSLVWRAALAVALMIGFYLLALAIAAALLYIPYAEWTFAHQIHLKLLVACVGGAAVILLAILPRRDRFAPPGPALTEAEQPRLFGALHGIAAATRQAMPAEVYLVPDANAWVAQRGGVMGFGSRRVMGLGLPLLRALSVPQLCAVLAHEFGHFHGGDTRLGPWVYKTRAAIARTLEGLAGNSLLQKPFEWYAQAFLRITQAISRRQELAADALAAATVGACPLAEGLRKVHGVALAYDLYWRTELVPVLRAGFLPPIAEGFHTFLSVPAVAANLERAIAAHAEQAATDPYDSHPALRDRLAALGDQAAAEQPTDATVPAITLLDDLAGLERQLLGSAGAEVAELQGLAWDDVEAKVWLPTWRQVVREQADALRGLTAGAIADVARDPSLFVAALHDAPESPSAEQVAVAANGVIGAAFTCALDAAGWMIHAGPGQAISAGRDGMQVLPFSILPALRAGTLSADAWRELCMRYHLVDLPLAAAAHAEA